MFGVSFEEEKLLHERLAWGVIYTSIPTFFILMYVVPSPWGKTGSVRFQQSGILGPSVPARPAWIFFESPNLLLSLYLLYRSHSSILAVNLLLIVLFIVHYIQRAIIYPLLMSNKSKPLPLAVVVSAFSYCCVNGYLQGQGLCKFDLHSNDTFLRPHFLFGLFLFLSGVYVNLSSDAHLRHLRRANPNGRYEIPTGGFFDLFNVSSPHFAGEIMEWTGFAIASWPSTAAASFAIFTVANLIPRAVAHHKWYQQTFGAEYPQSRRAVIPFVW